MVPRSQPTSWSLPHRVTVSGNNNDRRLQMDTKRQNRQIPWAFCPEFFNSDPKVCSMCGGDNTVKGTCEDLLVSGDQYGCPDGKSCRGYYCKCSDNGGPDNSPKVTMTSVVDGQTGIVVWEPMTLDDYRSLRASTTIELTETATASRSGAGSELETVAAVVFAGGVAWYLACSCSEGDDEKCQNDGHKPDCDDCGGNNPLALCSSGAQQFCPCEEQQCPADTPPSCGALECAGEESNLQCTVNGKLKGCQCCPTDPPKCDDEQCQGDDKEKCQSGTYKDCGCEVREFDWEDAISDPSFPATANSAALIAQAAISLDKIWSDDKTNVPGYEEPQAYCLYG
ncbi:hypothetical protein K491DRAFT_647028 [Lophiostoma macrostomum CBS 122681]|uniref:Uncharacterized protein n=1 Tax=Lophiostoma macrostomum CBS 122681 TaxID=1314788 RepID=A0A6A6TQR6_9PLEO|nr:hypothetical protein K491DRAFT_647028 [Lophiostoma macrostomum CBS 122681]